jgi:hypothetical protein
MDKAQGGYVTTNEFVIGPSGEHYVPVSKLEPRSTVTVCVVGWEQIRIMLEKPEFQEKIRQSVRQAIERWLI